MSATAEAAEPTWIDVTGGYTLTIDDGAIRARNAKGKQLKSVPAKVKKTEEYLQLDSLLTWLKTHDEECGTQVETWLLRSLPVPSVVLAEVWRDETWQSWLRDLIIQAADDASVAGFLRDVTKSDDGKVELGVVDLDGETRTIVAEEILIPHPVLLDDLEDLREFAADLGVEQRFDQLQRAVYERPDPLPKESLTSLDEWAGATFEKARFAVNRAQSGGFIVKGGYAKARIYEDGHLVEASYWIDSDEHPEYEAHTGALFWLIDGSSVSVREVGPVAYSEGVRMATHIHAGRTVEEGDDA